MRSDFSSYGETAARGTRNGASSQLRRRPRIRAALRGAVFGALLVASLSACTTGSASPSPVASQPTESQPAKDGSAMVTNTELIGTWTSDEPGNPTLTFAPDGTVSGTDGCNGIGSTFEETDAGIEIRAFATTRMACKGIDDWLGGVRGVSVDGDTLTVLDSQGQKIGELQRQADEPLAD